jgi:choline dehydrogenase
MGVLSSKPYHTDLSAFATKVDSASIADVTPNDYKTYDYIIVGAGAAGCVLASRLSEDPNVTVLLVEAGGDHKDSFFSKIPIGFARQFRTPFDWAYDTVPQPNLNNRKLFQPRGKILGGSTSMNAMMYHHCSPSDFDEWERMGAEGWGYKDLYPFFHSAEKFTPDPLYPDIKIEERGVNGLWHTGISYCSKVCKQSLTALKEVGIPYNPDVNTPRGCLGATKFVTFIDPNGRRSSSATAYLSKDVVARKNLTIAIKTLTTRVLFSSSDFGPRATGIEVAKDKSSPRFRVSAGREVIIAAGALNTPQILNLSGIGATEELEKFGIEVVKDLPAVGKNLSDHLTSGAVTFRAKKGYTLSFMANLLKSLPYLIYWIFTGKGPASSNLGEVAAFVRSQDPNINFGSAASKNDDKYEDTTSGSDAPDLEVVTAPVAFLNHGFTKPPPGDCFAILSTLLRPLSIGTVSISSASPFEPAIVDPNYLSNPNDVKILLRGARLCLRIGRAKAMESMLNLKSHSTDKTTAFWPGDADPDKLTDEELLEFIRSHAQTLYHPVGTAKIGLDEKDSVVAPDLKVHGVQGLRIVDASIFPSQISGHPTAPIIAIAEKASVMIAKARVS